MRGIAAVVVMLYHYLIDYSDGYPLGFFKNAFIAVDFFFILSGFVICHAYMDKLKQGMAASEYVARRVGRLYPLVAIALILAAPVFYLQTVSFPDYTPRDFAATLINNLAMLPNLLAAKHASIGNGLFPSDGALWSISFEMLASLAFPLLIQLTDRQLRTVCLCSLGLLIVSSGLRGFASYKFFFDMGGGWDIDNVLGGFCRLFFAFPCGILLYRLRQEKTGAKALSPWLLYGGLAALLAFPWYAKGIYAIGGAVIAAPLLIWCGSVSVAAQRITTRISEFLGWLSYPLYCLHDPAFSALRYVEKTVAFCDFRFPG
jgi:peptidoglycan/LPS O-acetylase OafA/YrhL